MTYQQMYILLQYLERNGYLAGSLTADLLIQRVKDDEVVAGQLRK